MEKNNEGVAFALVIAAGASTAIGSAAVFFPRLGVKLANRRTLAASLGLAAGVMTYVSLVDIYGKSITGFEDEGHEEGKAFIYATICFFSGCFLMMILNKIVELLLRRDASGHIVQDDFYPDDATKKFSDSKLSDSELVHSPSPHFSEDPLKQVEELGMMAQQLSEVQADDEEEEARDTEEDGAKELNGMAPQISEIQAGGEEEARDAEEAGATDPSDMTKAQQARLFRLGAATALAIAIHNLPEGLITFITYMEDPAVGIALAVGIAIHNIPEGLCVSMPLFYATGKRWKSFWWGMLSGVSEPIGALIGWGVLKSSFSGNTYGIMFGLVSGIMAYISLDELLPSAHRYDPRNTVVTKALLFGMFAMALSLMLFSV